MPGRTKFAGIGGGGKNSRFKRTWYQRPDFSGFADRLARYKAGSCALFQLKESIPSSERATYRASMVSEATLVFPHQLFHDHPGITTGRRVFLVEDPLVFGDPMVGMEFHAQKILLHRASIRAYAEELRGKGITVEVVAWRAGMRTDELLAAALPEMKRVMVAEPEDFLLEKRLRRWAADSGVEMVVVQGSLFLSPRPWVENFLAGKKRVIMADFYKAQRQRLGILVEPDGSPIGGRWSFDEENRKRLPKGMIVPADPRPVGNPAWMEDCAASVRRDFPRSFGSTEGFAWPVTAEGALVWLDEFLQTRLVQFGDYEDAIHTRERVLFHGALTPMMNVGLLTPEVVVQRTLDFAAKHAVPLNALEGFIRQVIGWREFMRVMYHRHGVTMRTRNFWGFTRPMPRAFYDGTTGIGPVDETIRRVLKHGWCHHIERLMVLGAMFLLCRIRPDDVYRWFMELFVDAYDWVMVPNVYGMSQFADGGIFTTKPYLCGSNYILKMSDWKKGDWCEIWDGLYWTFIADHADVFAANHRMSMMARLVAGMDPAKLAKHREVSDAFVHRIFADGREA